jgi:hypothetical protein
MARCSGASCRSVFATSTRSSGAMPAAGSGSRSTGTRVLRVRASLRASRIAVRRTQPWSAAGSRNRRMPLSTRIIVSCMASSPSSAVAPQIRPTYGARARSSAARACGAPRWAARTSSSRSMS